MVIGSNSIKIQDKILALGSKPSLSSQDISHNLKQRNARSVLTHRDERNSQKQKTYRKNVYRFSIPKLIAESFSATVIFFHTLENYSQNITSLTQIYKTLIRNLT
ncbi:hypothetical protein QL285_084585 [Trifolium repens]|nr:hypothetical protein QL285_084585 [Trifolium repens]